MAESALSVKYDDLVEEVARFLGYKSMTYLSKSELDEVDRYIQSGLRNFYYPPAADGIEAGYEWSFLNPTTTIDTIAPYSTGTLGVVSGICTLTGGTWPTWAATLGTLVIDSTTYTITTRDSAAQLTVVGDDVTAGESDWTLSRSASYDLPDLCGRVLSDFFFEPDTYSQSIPVVSEAQMMTFRQRTTDESRPAYAAVRFRSDATTKTTGQRLEVVFWPTPDAAYSLTYRYEGYTGKLTSALPYPLGGMRHAELITESCLAVAEQRANDEKGLHWDSFVRMLRSGIEQDRKLGARYYGHMGADNGVVVERRGFCGTNYPVTYKGETW